jgi:hypothetical protein
MIRSGIATREFEENLTEVRVIIIATFEEAERTRGVLSERDGRGFDRLSLANREFASKNFPRTKVRRPREEDVHFLSPVMACNIAPLAEITSGLGQREEVTSRPGQGLLTFRTDILPTVLRVNDPSDTRGKGVCVSHIAHGYA